MKPSAVAVGNFTLAGHPSPAAVPGLVLWARADVGVASDGYGKVSRWRDVSGRGNDLSQADPALQPSFVPDAQASRPVVRLDGDDVLLFKSRLTTIRTVFWVIREDPEALDGYRFLFGDATAYDFYSGAAHELWSVHSNPAITGGETRINGVLVNGMTTNRPTNLSVVSLVTTANVTADAFSRDRIYGRSWRGDLAELVVYDRALTAAERKSVEDALALKYKLFTPTVATPTITPAGGTISGSQTVQITTSTPGATIHYTDDNQPPKDTSPAYSGPFVVTDTTRIRARAFLKGETPSDDWNPSAETVVTFYGPETFTPASLPDLALWVRADAGLALDGSPWEDQGPAHNSLVQTAVEKRPEVVFDAASRMPVLRFDGVDDGLFFTSRLTTIRTVFWVIRRSAAMKPGYRFLLGDLYNYDFCADSGMALWSATWASTAVQYGQTRLDGAPVDGRVTDRPLDLSVLSLVTTGNAVADSFSRDRTNPAFSWWGDLAELVIFDRALTSTEVQEVEAYLAGRYGIGLAP
jgi:hypothetical protein